MQWVLDPGHLPSAVLWLLPEAVLPGRPGTFQSPNMRGAGSGALGILVLFSTRDPKTHRAALRVAAVYRVTLMCPVDLSLEEFSASSF